MSDREVLEYLSRARGGACGRLGDDQVNRDFRLAEVGKRRKWMGWGVLAAGLLLGSRGAAQQQAPKPEMHQMPAGSQRDGVTGPGLRHGEGIADVGVKKGEPASQADSFKMLPPVTVKALDMGKVKITMGAVMFCRKEEIVDRLKSKVMDSLAFLGLPVKKELGVYPNPARRGTVVSLSWQSEPGRYQVGLFNTAGALMQQRLLEVHEPSQVDLFEIPAVLPGGVYFLRAVKAGGAKVITKKIVVI